MATAFITGITGQDGSFLAEQLLAAGQNVVGLVRRSSGSNLERLAPLLDGSGVPSHPGLALLEGDLLDLASLISALRATRPDCVYNLASQSSVATSWTQPLLTADVTALGAARLLEAVRLAAPEARFYQAGSSEMFGLATSPLQDEHTPFHPRSPYAAAKVFAHHLAVNYRESYGMFVANGILFNHESERRGAEFVTRKITLAAARIRRGQQRQLRLSTLDARRDWGFAADYTDAMRRMLALDGPADLVIATGRSWSVRDFATRAFAALNLNWEDHVVLDPALRRPADVPALCGDASRAAAVLGWTPTLDLDGLVARMVRYDFDRCAV